MARLVALKYPFGQRSDLSHIPFTYPSSSWEGTVSSTASSSIDLVTPKITQAYPSTQNSKTMQARPPWRTCLITKSAKLMLRTSASSLHDPRHEDAMMTSELTLSSLAWLTASTNYTRHPVRCVGASLCQGWQYERALHLHATQGRRRARRFTARTRCARPSRSYNQLVEEEVCRCKAEDKRHVFAFNIIGALYPRPDGALLLRELPPAHQPLLRNAVKPEGVDNPTADDIRSVLFLPSRLHSNASPPHVTDILPQTKAKI
ncbi:hypothetical protein EDB89DRAFT_584428 [Lactarius sanguifluus]|nr:hypothetical protein EDB89DRAFT_584428 [Lactarius sanguifluus]